MIGNLNASYLNQLYVNGAYPFVFAAGGVVAIGDTTAAAVAVDISAAGVCAPAADSVTSAVSVVVSAAGGVSAGADSVSGAAAPLVDACGGVFPAADAVSSAGTSTVVCTSSMAPGADYIDVSSYMSTQAHAFASRLGSTHAAYGGISIHSTHGSVVRH